MRDPSGELVGRGFASTMVVVMRAMAWWAPLAAVIAAIGVVIAGDSEHVSAQPMVPATYYGTASIDGHALPDGTEIAAIIGGKNCTQPGGNGTIIEGNASVYVVTVMHESQSPGCGAEGKTIVFRVGTRDAVQTATWHAGLQRLDLNAGSGSTLPLPSQVNPTISEAGRQATATEQAKFTPRTGSPPTDDISLTRTPAVPDPGLPGSKGDDGGGGVSPLLVILAVTGVLIVLGAAGGVALSRRGQRSRS